MSQDRPLNHDEMLAVLDWYRAAGVDIAVGEEPVDRFAQRPPVRPAASAGPFSATLPSKTEERPAVPVPVLPIGGDPVEARNLAAAAQNLEELQAALSNYDGCGLKVRATQLVFADGNPQARIMLIGEAPNADEDQVGKPFVGRAGHLLDRMLAAIGLDRTKVYVANTVPWRPPGNRTPSPEELALCLPFLHRQVELVAPRIIVTMGGPAMQTIFGTTSGIIKARGVWHDVTIGQHQAIGMPTLHPAHLLRNPAAKEQAWSDLLGLKQKMLELEIS